MPGPVHDEFLQAFIITKGRESFYLDQNGIFDYNYHKIQWSGKVSRVFVANPYLVAFLESDQNPAIEVRNIFNPSRIFYRKELAPCQFITMCVSQNLINRSNGNVDDFYIVTKSNLSDTYTLTKFSQERPEKQLKHLHELKQYSTCLKFVDLLRDHNPRAAIS